MAKSRPTKGTTAESRTDIDRKINLGATGSQEIRGSKKEHRERDSDIDWNRIEAELKKKLPISHVDMQSDGVNIDQPLLNILNSLANHLDENPTDANVAYERIAEIFKERARSTPKKDPEFVAYLVAKGRDAWEANRKKTKAEGKLNPSAWLRATFPDEIADGRLPRSMLQDIHQGLYSSYATWIRRHPNDDLGLATEPWTKYSEDDLRSAVHPSNPQATPTSAGAYAALKNRESYARRKKPEAQAPRLVFRL